jgi:hypothetical protein
MIININYQVKCTTNGCRIKLTLKNGAELQANEFLEGELLFGEGRAYGLELMLRKEDW